MSIDQVIEIGNINYETSIFAWRYWICWIIVLVLILGEVGVWIGEHNEEKLFSNKLKNFGLAVVVIIFLYFVNEFSDYTERNKLIDEWKYNVAMPYISQLNEYKKDIIYIKIDPELSHSTSGSFLYTYSNEIHRTPLVVSFKNDGITTITNWFETSMELTDGQTPYITYKWLDVDLGNGINKGMYDIKIHLPDSYKFTEIK